MSSSQDILLKEKYKDLVKLSYFNTVSTGTIINTPISISSNLYISGYSLIKSFVSPNINVNTCYLNDIYTNNIQNNNLSLVYNNITCNNTLNIQNDINNNNLAVTDLSVIGSSLIYGNSTIKSTLNTNNLNTFTNVSNIVNSLSTCVINNNISITSDLNSYGNNNINVLTITSALYLSSNAYLSNITFGSNLNSNTLTNIYTTINSKLFVSNMSTIENNSIISKQLISNTINAGTCNIYGPVNISNNIICQLPEYLNDTLAAANNIEYWQLYRTGGIVKIRSDVIAPIITLNGDNTILLYIYDTYIELGVTIVDNLNEILNPIITGTVDTTTIGTYYISYYCVDSFSNQSNTVIRTINVVNYPKINSMNYSNGSLIFTINGVYDSISYSLVKQNIEILSDTSISQPIINLLLDSTPLYVTINLKRSSGAKILLSNICLTDTLIGPLIQFNNSLPYFVKLSSTYNIYSNILASSIPLFTTITLTQSNVTIINNLNQPITTPANGILSKAYGDIFTITYSLTNNSLTSSITITSQVIDDIPPVITLLGSNPMIIYLNDAYIDPGYTVTDNSGITPTVSVSGFVDTTVEGIYNITYTATDTSNNKSSVVRSVTVARTKDIYRFAPLIVYDDRFINGRFFKYNTNIISQLRSSISWTIEGWMFVYNMDSPFSQNWANTSYYDKGNNPVYPPPSNPYYTSRRNGATPCMLSLVYNTTEIVSFYLSYGDGDCNFNPYIKWQQATVTYNNSSYSTIDPYINAWHHLAITYDGTTLRFFVNGGMYQTVYTYNNYLLGTNVMTSDKVYIGINGGDTDTNLLNNIAKFPGYISQVAISNVAKYTANFIPSLNLEPTNSNTIFYLDNDYIDSVSKQAATIVQNYAIDSAVIKLKRLTVYSSKLIYSFPGGILLNNYWCLHDNTKGNTWSFDPSLSQPLYNPIQDWSNGISIAYDYTYIYNKSSYWPTDFSLTNAFFYIGPNPDNTSLPSIAFIAYNNSYSDHRLLYNGTSINIGTLGLGLRATYGSRMLITISPTGTIKAYYCGYLFYTANTGKLLSSISYKGIWFGRYNSINYTGPITNIKIYNDVMPYEIAFQ